jgi:hypothetical protein
MLLLKTNIGTCKSGQPGAEIQCAILDGATQYRAQPLEAANCKPVKKGLFVCKVAGRRGMATPNSRLSSRNVRL